MAKESWYISESELDDYQYQIIQTRLEHSFIVKGCAGSGKTVLALWRAKEIQESGIGDYYVIVFTVTLKKFIEDGIKTIGVDENRITHFYEWKKNQMPSADFIIVDEVQDFSRDEITILQNAAKKALIIFGDSAQQIYGFMKKELMTMEEIQVFTKIPMENLSINYRLPKKVARVADQISKEYDRLENRCKKEGADKPAIIKCDSFEDELDTIMTIIEAKDHQDVGILLRKNYDVKRVYEYFLKTKKMAERKYSENHANVSNLNFLSRNPKIMTYHSSKGLQFETVFLPDCSVEDEENRNALYVAITRSYRNLYFLHSGNLSPLIENIDSKLFDFQTDIEDDEDLPF